MEMGAERSKYDIVSDSVYREVNALLVKRANEHRILAQRIKKEVALMLLRDYEDWMKRGNGEI